jgi:HEAT repeat protein
MFQTFIDPFSFFVGFAAASLFWFLVARARPLWREVRAGWKEGREAAQARKTSSVEENHRRNTLRRAQGLHLAAPLFALNEILLEPALLSPPQPVEPGIAPKFEDLITQTLPYLPTWPEIAAAYRPHTLSLPEALAGNANIVILGQPGAGKTVALAHLASLAANRSEALGANQNLIPFLVHVADLRLPIKDPKNALDPIIETAAEFAPVFDLGKMPDFVRAAFKSGNALLLVDGYDEIPAEEQKGVAEYLKTVISGFPRIRIVVAGAPEYVDGLIPLGFAPLALCAWSAREHNQFIDRWGQLWSQTVAMEAWAQAGPEQVDPLLLNSWLGSDNATLSPLELTLKVWGAYAGDSLGSHVLETLATHIRRIAPPNTPLAALETLAMQVILNSQPVFDSRNARDWVRSFEVEEDLPPGEEEPAEGSAGEAQEGDKPRRGRRRSEKTVPVPLPTSGLLGKMANSGLLIEHPNNRMRFAHAVFAGYLAGHAFANFSSEETILNQPDWSGKYLSMRYLAAHGDAGKLIQSMLEFSRLPMHRPLFAAARWLRDAPRSAAWRGKLFGTLAAVMQTEGLPLSLRGQAMAAFVYSKDPSAATLFRQFAASLSFELAHLAILGLGAMQDAKSVSILENALHAPSLSVQRAACMALVAVGTNAALEVVARALLGGDEEIRRIAGEALANDEREGYAMLRDGASLQDILLRRAVMYGLGRIDESWAAELLQKMQVDDDQWVVRNAATEVLEARAARASFAPVRLKPPHESAWLIEFAAKNGTGVSPGAPATDILLTALKGENVEYALAALSYLKFTPKEGVIAQLYNAMYRDDPDLREAAFHTLWEIGISGVKLPDPSQFGLG